MGANFIIREDPADDESEIIANFPNLRSQAEVDAVKAEIQLPAYAGMNDEEIAIELCQRPMVANPDAADNVPDPAKFNRRALLSQLSGAELALIPEDSLNRVGDSIKAGEVDEVLMALSVWLGKNYILQAKHDTLVGLVTATVPDPNYKAQVPGDWRLKTILSRDAAISADEVALCENHGA